MTPPRNALGQFTSVGGSGSSGSGADQVLTVSIVTNQSSAQQTQQALNQHDQSIKQLLRSYQTLSIAGHELTQVGRTVALGGAAILVPLIAAANTYAQRYGQLEAQSRSFLQAQNAQASATANLGRQAASALTPLMNQMAQFENQVASFFQAHPEFLQMAVGAGGILTAGGAGLIALGTAISSTAHVLDLAKAISAAVPANVGGLNVAPAVGVAGAVAGGVAAGVYGAAALGVGGTNDPSVEWTRLKQILMTGISLIAQPFFVGTQLLQTGFGDIGNVLSEAKVSLAKSFNDLGAGIGNILLQLSSIKIGNTTFTNPTLAQQGQMLVNQANVADSSHFLIMNAAGQQVGMIAAPGVQQGSLQEFQFQNQNVLPGLQKGDSIQFIEGFNEQLARLSSTISTSFDPKKIVAAAQGNSDSFLKGVLGVLFPEMTPQTPLPTATTNGTSQSPEAVNDYIQFRQAQVQADTQFQTDEKNLQSQYNDQELKAQQDHLQQLADQQTQYQQQVSDAATNYQQNSLKAQQEFAFSELQQEQKEAFQKQQQTQQEQLKLDQLSAARDVEGFINEQASYQLQQTQQDQQNDFDAQQRQESFDEQQQERATEYQQQLDQLKLQNTQRVDQLNQQYVAQQKQDATAYAQQLQALKDKHTQEDLVLAQNYAKQLADLTGNVAGLNEIQGNYYAWATQQAQNYVTTNSALLRQLYNSTLNVPGSTGGGSVANPGGIGAAVGSVLGNYANLGTGTPFQDEGTAFPSYASGIDRIPRDMLIVAHQGERITRAVDNQPGSGQRVFHITVNNTVGDIATKRDLDNAVDDIAAGLRRAVVNT